MIDAIKFWIAREFASVLLFLLVLVAIVACVGLLTAWSALQTWWMDRKARRKVQP